MAPRSRESALQATVASLRAAALACAEGDLIGWEEDLLPRFGVSRPTLRQAAALVAQEQLIRVRRGAGGGYFARRPDAKAVTHMAAIYLQSHDVHLSEAVLAAEPIMIELARLAARCASSDLRAKLETFLEKDRLRRTEDMTWEQFGQSAREFGHLVGTMSGNRVLSMFLGTIYDFVYLTSPARQAALANEEGVTREMALERLNLHRAGRHRLAEAILSSDETAAVECARRNAYEASRYLLDNLERRNKLETASGRSSGGLATRSPWAEVLR